MTRGLQSSVLPGEEVLAEVGSFLKEDPDEGGRSSDDQLQAGDARSGVLAEQACL
eukprot:GSA25T00002273001.1